MLVSTVKLCIITIITITEVMRSLCEEAFVNLECIAQTCRVLTLWYKILLFFAFATTPTTDVVAHYVLTCSL